MTSSRLITAQKSRPGINRAADNLWQILLTGLPRRSRIATALCLLLTIALGSSTLQADARNNRPGTESSSIINDFENSILDELLARLQLEFNQIPNNILSFEFSETRIINDKLNILNYYHKQIQSIDTQRLDSERLLRLKLLRYTQLMLQQQARFSAQDHALSPYHGPQVDLLRLLSSHPINPDSGLTPLLAQVTLLNRSLQQAPILHENLTTAECLTLKNGVKALGETTALRDTLHYRLVEMGLPERTQQTYLDQFDVSLEASITPALKHFYANIDCNSATNGPQTEPDYYQYRLRRFSADERSAESIHALGLVELQKIQEALTTTQWQNLHPETSTNNVYEQMRATQDVVLNNNDARQQYLSTVTDQILAIQQASTFWVSDTPLTSLEIIAAPPLMSRYALPIEYQQPSETLGQMVINFSESSPSWHELTAKTYYYTIPGIHQVRQQPRSLSTLLSANDDPGYISGWSLYLTNMALDATTERPKDRLGLLAMNAELAAMLVIDTGLHHLYWTRQQAINFLLANTATPKATATRLVDEVRFRPAVMSAPYLGMLRAKQLVGSQPTTAQRWRHLVVTGPVPVPLLPELQGWLNSH